MATLVLTTVGSALGGPIGGALGALIGQSVDNSLFASKRDGPRLDSLAVQSSRYGTALPLLFGRTRTAGAVIWATDLAESRATSGGKGKPRVTNYSYTADFAVALSARPVRRIARVWADGALLTRADGALDVAGAMRLHPGTEDQMPDPLIEAEEGRGRAPAYRGLAYVVFEGLALERFGNRVPMLSFEVVADEEPLAIGPVVERLSGGLLAGPTEGSAVGAAFADATRRSALTALADPFGLALTGGDRPRLGSPSVSGATPLDRRWLGARQEGEAAVAAVTLTDRPAPTSVALDFAEPARDHQPGRQRAATGGGDARPLERALPLALDAVDAKALATAWLDRAGGAARRATVTATLAALSLVPGECVRLPDAPGVWRVVDWLLERMVIRLELEPVVASESGALAADGGRSVPGTPPSAGEVTRVELFELAYPPNATAAVLVAIGRAGATDRPVPLLARTAAGTEAIGPSAPAALLGRIEAPPGPASALLFDRRSAIVVALTGAGDLADADDAALSAGANAALVGDEMVQFASARPLGKGRWRLSGLLRGRRGTEPAIGRAAVGDRFVLLDPATLQPLPDSGVGEVTVIAAPDDGRSPTTVSAPLTPSPGPRPLPPVHLSARARPDGGRSLRWIRQSRDGCRWVDGADAPLVEEREAYQVTLSDGRSFDTAEPTLELPASPADPAFTVAQLGTHGLSQPASYQGPNR